MTVGNRNKLTLNDKLQMRSLLMTVIKLGDARGFASNNHHHHCELEPIIDQNSKVFYVTADWYRVPHHG